MQGEIDLWYRLLLADSADGILELRVHSGSIGVGHCDGLIELEIGRVYGRRGRRKGEREASLSTGNKSEILQVS